MLTFLFLFGIALDKTDVISALGNDGLNTLIQAGIIGTNPTDDPSVVGEVQIYPLSTDKFELIKVPNLAQSLLFMSDWSMESLRLPRDAIWG